MLDIDWNLFGIFHKYYPPFLCFSGWRNKQLYKIYVLCIENIVYYSDIKHSTSLCICIPFISTRGYYLNKRFCSELPSLIVTHWPINRSKLTKCKAL